MKTVVTNLRALHCVMAPLLIFIYLTRPDLLFAQNSLDRTGNPTATPVVAFSLRQLSSAYTGNAIQVRRSSDNSTMDIGFTSAGDLDTVTLKNFVGSDSGYVKTWYDQSGNNYHATQNTDSLQPTIMQGGFINRDNGKPAVYTYGGNGYLLYGPITQLNGGMQVTRMEVARSQKDSFSISEGLGKYQMDLQLFPGSPGTVMVQFEDHNITASGTVPDIKTLMSINSVRDNGASKVYVNTNLLGTTTGALNPFTSPVMGYIGVRFDFHIGNPGPGAFSETMVFNSVLSDADRLSINCNENTYYSLGIGSCNSILPITISAFTGKRENDKTVLAWTTTSETNSEWFKVERSTDGSDWKEIALVAAAGNSSTPSSYRLTDGAPLTDGNNLYYRLKMVDKDGRYTWSNIVFIKLNDNTPQVIRVVPNPVENVAVIGCIVPVSGTVEVQLRDMTGVMMIHRTFTAKKGDNVLRLTNLNAVPRGTYIVRLVQGGAVGIGKVIKQ